MTLALSARDDSGKLRVAHCVGFYFPDSVGGTEVYVHDLVTELSGLGVESRIVAATDRSFEQYAWEGIPVLRYPSDWADRREYVPSSPRAELSKFQELVLSLDVELFHLHSWTSGSGLRHLAQIAQLGIPCVVTVHVPSALCVRGTMLLNGTQACDGRIDEKRCGQCWAMARGLPGSMAWALSRLPKMKVETGWLSNASRRAATMLSVRAMVSTQLEELHQMTSACEAIVAPSQWVHSALVANGIPAQKLVISRQAVSRSLAELGADRPQRPRSNNLRIGFVGRLEHYKGAHVLLEALSRIPREVDLTLVIAGSGTEWPYLHELVALAGKDERIEFLGPVSREELPNFLGQIDVLAVPSNYMETGPLVVLEGLAFGVPVMGANIGGIAERVRDGVDGWLLPFNDSAAWAVAMQEAARDRQKLARLAANVAPSRTMGDVAMEMATLYRRVIGARSRAGL